MTTPFISADDLQSYLKLPDGLMDNDLAVISVDSASSTIVTYLGQEILANDAVDVSVRTPRVRVIPDSSPLGGPDTLLLPNFPILEISEFSEDGTDILEDGTYELMPDSGLVLRDTLSFSEASLYRLTYSYGYDTVPSTVRMVALQLAMRSYEFSMYRQETIGPLQASYAEGEGQLTERERDALYNFRTNS